MPDRAEAGQPEAPDFQESGGICVIKPVRSVVIKQKQSLKRRRALCQIRFQIAVETET